MMFLIPWHRSNMTGIEQTGVDIRHNHDFQRVPCEFAEAVFQKLDLDPRYFRPAAVDVLIGDSSKARRKLAWEPKVSFDQLIDMMIEADLELAMKEKILFDASYGKGLQKTIRWYKELIKS
jgi:GDP-D-mannose dehydratase